MMTGGLASGSATQTPDSRHAPDIHSSGDAYAGRFTGAAGAYLLAVQTRAVLRLLAPWPGATVLDVGGGHAQLAVPLAAAGYRVTLLGSDDACFERARRLAGDVQIDTLRGDLMDPPLPDQSVDLAVSFRIMPHIADWRRLVAGLCRVARHAVLIDYPAARSVNAVAPLLFGAKKKFEGNTRDYDLFKRREVKAAFAAAGFGEITEYAQFFWPMVLHRALGRPPLSRIMETPARLAGLTKLAGSPIILRARRTRRDL